MSILGHDEDGNGGLWLHNKLGVGASSLTLDKAGNGGTLDLLNKSGIRTTMLGHDGNGNSYLSLADRFGKETSLLGHDISGNAYLALVDEDINGKRVRTSALGHDQNGIRFIKLFRIKYDS